MRKMPESLIALSGIVIALLQATGPEKLALLRKYAPERLKWTMLIVGLGCLLVGLAAVSTRQSPQTQATEELRFRSVCSAPPSLCCW